MCVCVCVCVCLSVYVQGGPKVGIQCLDPMLYTMYSIPTFRQLCILNYITDAPTTCLDAPVTSSGSFDIVFAKVIRY